MARRQAQCPDFAGRPGDQPGNDASYGCARVCRRAIAVSVRFRVSRCTDDAGPNSPHRLLRVPLGGGITTPTLKYRIPLPLCGVPRRTPLAWNETMGIYVNYWNKARTHFREVRGARTSRLAR